MDGTKNTELDIKRVSYNDYKDAIKLEAENEKTKKNLDKNELALNEIDLEINICKTKHNESEINDLTLFEKLCFGVSGLPYQLYFCAVSVFTAVFLLNKAGLKPEKTTIMDAITDPIYGFLVEKTPITRFGKMKPWIAVSIPICALSYVMMWYAPPGFSENQLFIWFIFWHSAIFTFMTGYRIPHTAMTMYISKSKLQRQSATVIRMASEMVGLLLALGIQGPFVSGDSNCIKLDGNETSKNETDQENTPVLTNWEINKYTYIALIMTAIFLIGTSLLVFFVNEKKELLEAGEKSNQNSKKISTLKELKRIFTFKPYLILMFSTILATSSVQILQANLQLYFEYGYIAIKDYFIITILALLGFAILFVPLFQFMLKKMEKKYVFMIGNLTIIPLLIGILFFKTNNLGEVITFFALAVFGASSFTSAFVVPWATLPETLDDYFIKFGSKPDALFYTFFVLGTKVLMAVYLAISQAILDLVGFKTNVCSEYQNLSVQKSIKYLISPAPMAFLILSSIIVYFYPIDSKTAIENSEKINRISDDENRSEIISNNGSKQQLVQQENDVAYFSESGEAYRF